MHPTLLDHLAWLEGNVCLMKWRANDRRKRCPEKKLHLPVRPKRRLVLCRKPTLCQFQRLCLLRRQIVLLRLFRPALQNDRRHLACHRYLRRRRTVRRHGKQTSEYREAGRHNCLYAVPHGLAVTSAAAARSADMENNPPNPARPAATIAFTPFLMGSRSPPTN